MLGLRALRRSAVQSHPIMHHYILNENLYELISPSQRCGAEKHNLATAQLEPLEVVETERQTKLKCIFSYPQQQKSGPGPNFMAQLIGKFCTYDLLTLAPMSRTACLPHLPFWESTRKTLCCLKCAQRCVTHFDTKLPKKAQPRIE